MLKKFLSALAVIAATCFLPTIAHAGECQLYETIHPNFLLDGSHVQAGKCTICASCHTNAMFMGTPKNCDACHGSAGLRASVYKSPSHFDVTSNACSDCHNTTSYVATWSMNHAAVPAGVRCDSCHNGSYEAYNAMSKADFVSSSYNPALNMHLVTTADCNTCHVPPTSGMKFPVTAWQNVSISTIHAGLTLSSTCSGCHNGVIATGKNSATTGAGGVHPATSLECGSCHSFTAGFKCADAVDAVVNYFAMAYDNIKASLTHMLA